MHVVVYTHDTMLTHVCPHTFTCESGDPRTSSVGKSWDLVEDKGKCS